MNNCSYQLCRMHVRGTDHVIVDLEIHGVGFCRVLPYVAIAASLVVSDIPWLVCDEFVQPRQIGFDVGVSHEMYFIKIAPIDGKILLKIAIKNFDIHRSTICLCQYMVSLLAGGLLNIQKTMAYDLETFGLLPCR
ncbi:hypothetical protein MRB53_039518 [Persea americana]|nr:hypothetical protein MRB53_039518 [Persea americana]